MSDTTPHTNNLLIQLTKVYGKPQSDDATGFYAEFARQMAGYTKEERQEAADKLIATRKWKTWPALAECLEALRLAREQALLKKTSQQSVDHFKKRMGQEKQDQYFFSALSKVTALELIKSPMGQKAAAEGWILGLYDYCRKYGKLPDPYSPKIKLMKEGAQFLDECLAGRMDMGAQAVALRKLGQSLMARRLKLIAFVEKHTGDAA